MAANSRRFQFWDEENGSRYRVIRNGNGGGASKKRLVGHAVQCRLPPSGSRSKHSVGSDGKQDHTENVPTQQVLGPVSRNTDRGLHDQVPLRQRYGGAMGSVRSETETGQVGQHNISASLFASKSDESDELGWLAAKSVPR